MTRGVLAISTLAATGTLAWACGAGDMPDSSAAIGDDTSSTAVGNAIGGHASSAAVGNATTRAAGPDSARLLRDLSILAHDSMGGRATGSVGNEQARRYIVAQLSEAGARPVPPGFEHPFSWGDSDRGVNVVGRIDGRDPVGTIVLTAHFDHVGIRDDSIYNGADDNASGTAAVLEFARIVATSPLRNDIVVALFDAEEVGLRGARAFVAAPAVPLDDRTVNVNLDMVSRGAGTLWAAGAFHTPALRPILEGVARNAPVTLRLGHDRPGAPEGDDWTGASDHGAFHDAGIPFVYFGVEDHVDYHRPTDDVERVDPGEYVEAVRTIFAALRALDDALPLSEAEIMEDPR